MLRRRSIRTLVVLTVAACLWLPLAASAQKYPDHPIDLVVPYPPGGNSDIIGRVVAE